MSSVRITLDCEGHFSSPAARIGVGRYSRSGQEFDLAEGSVYEIPVMLRKPEHRFGLLSSSSCLAPSLERVRLRASCL